MIKLTKSAACCTMLSLSLLAANHVAAAPLPVAGDYNTFVFGNADLRSDTQGRLAIGGNAKLTAYSVADQLSPTDITQNNKVLVVGGNLNFGSGRVFYGDAYVAAPTAQNHIPMSATIDGTLYENTPSPIDFASAKSTLTNYSNQLNQISANGSVLEQWGGITLTGDNTSPLQVFELNSTNLLNAHTLKLENIANDATVLINVKGANAGMTNMGLFGFESIRERVLFNFSEASNMQISGIGIHGSVLAPNASLNNGQGVIWGQLVLDSMHGNLQQNHASFNGNLPSIPEPGAGILIACGLLLLSPKRKARNT